MNITEPQAGSDLAAIRSKAVPEGDHYRISGTKIFITWGEHDMAREHRAPGAGAPARCAARRERHLAVRVPEVPASTPTARLGERNDLVCASIEHKMGIHGSATAVMSFGEGPGAIGWLVGEPNQGLACMFTMMNHARLNVGLEGVAISERAYQQAREFALDRVQGKTLGREGATQRDHHRPPRRAPHADGHEGAGRGDARAGLLHRRPDGPRPRPCRTRCRGRPRRPWSTC